VRDIVRAPIEGAGYRTLMAQNGVDALAVAKGHADPIDLLLTDVVMPKLGGVDLAEKLRARNPGLAILFVSGHTDHPSLEGGRLPAGTAFLAKPFHSAELLEAVHFALNQQRGDGQASPGSRV
jgi:CheY-like chemotaxis protein